MTDTVKFVISIGLSLIIGATYHYEPVSGIILGFSTVTFLALTGWDE